MDVKYYIPDQDITAPTDPDIERCETLLPEDVEITSTATLNGADITLTVTPPSGYQGEAYKFELSADGGLSWDVFEGETTQHTFRGLSPFGQYVGRVRAVCISSMLQPYSVNISTNEPFRESDPASFVAIEDERLIGSVEQNILGEVRSTGRRSLSARTAQYGLDPEFGTLPTTYSYILDPSTQWQIEPETGDFQGSFGVRTRFFPNQSAVQCYCYPPPQSFVYGPDDLSASPYGVGGRTDGVMVAEYFSKQPYYFQPGTASTFTFGIRTSHLRLLQEGNQILWGARSLAGDLFAFLLDSEGIKIRYFNSLGAEQTIPQTGWNGEQLLGAEGDWFLDPRYVCMYRIEFAGQSTGAKFSAMVPNSPANTGWVTLHNLILENSFTEPSLSSFNLQIFVHNTAIAGSPEPQWVNLYGHSVYLDSGPSTEFATTRSVSATRPIGPTARGVIGVQGANLVGEQRYSGIILPSKLAVSADADCIVSLRQVKAFRDSGIFNGYGLGTTLVAGSATTSVAVTIDPQNPNRALGDFSGIDPVEFGNPNGIKIANLPATFIAIKESDSSVILDRAAPLTTTTLELDPWGTLFLPTEFSSAQGTIYHQDLLVNSVRIGFWPSNGQNPMTDYDPLEVAWGTQQLVLLDYDASGTIVGDRAINSNNGTIDYLVDGGQLITDQMSVPFLGYPIYGVVEMRTNATATDLVVRDGSAALVGQVTYPTLPPGWAQNLPVGGTYTVPDFKLAENTDGVFADGVMDQTLANGQYRAQFLVAANTPAEFDLADFFALNRNRIAGSAIMPGEDAKTGAIIVEARAKSGTGTADLALTFKELT